MISYTVTKNSTPRPNAETRVWIVKVEQEALLCRQRVHVEEDETSKGTGSAGAASMQIFHDVITPDPHTVRLHIVVVGHFFSAGRHTRPIHLCMTSDSSNNSPYMLGLSRSK